MQGQNHIKNLSAISDSHTYTEMSFVSWLVAQISRKTAGPANVMPASMSVLRYSNGSLFQGKILYIRF